MLALDAPDLILPAAAPRLTATPAAPLDIAARDYDVVRRAVE